MAERMFIESLDSDYPKRVLSNIRLEYEGFCTLFSLPQKRYLEITIHIYTKNDTLEIYEHVVGTEPGRHWLIQPNRYEITGTDPLPLLETYLKTAIGGVEHGYEGSFAEVILAAMRNEKASV